MNFEQSSYIIRNIKRKIDKYDYEGAKALIDALNVSSERCSELIDVLFLSITQERRDIFHYILETTNLDLNTPNKNGESLLHQSLKCSDEYYLEELLKKGIQLNLKPYETILHDAVGTDKPKFVEPFLKHNAPLNNENIMGLRPLDIAMENDNFEIVSMLLYYNCDIMSSHGVSTSYGDGVSSFMYSMLCGCSKEIQLLLLEYEAGINTNLCIAIKRCKYLVPEMLARGADVNEICNNRNIMEIILENPLDPQIFKIIWDKFDYEIWETSKQCSILMSILFELNLLVNNRWFDYLRIIIESSKLMRVLEFDCPHFIGIFVDECLQRNLKECDFYDLLCVLLMNGCTVHAMDLHRIYKLGVDSKIIKLLIHMDIKTTNTKFVDINFIQIKYSRDTSAKKLMRNFAFNMRVFDMSSSYKDILRYFAVPPVVKKFLRNPDQSQLPFLTWGHIVPTLVELSRNSARDFIWRKYDIDNGGKYFSIVNHSDLPGVIKDILTFEKPLYYED